MESINVYAEKAESHGEGDQLCVFLMNVDPEQVVKEFKASDVLDAIEWSDIIEYVTEKRAEDGDE